MIRGAGKTKGNIKKNDFYKHYKENAKEEIISKPLYNSFIKELLTTFSKAIVKLGLELKINKVGKFRVRSKQLHFFNKDGTRAKSLKVDWQATWSFWHEKHPNLSKEEIIDLKNKQVIYHQNDHTDGEFYEHYWDKLTNVLKYKSFYVFKPSRQYSRLIAEVVKDPNRKVFYYG
jgi:hypothetical protein|tara:strand:- start:3559 stop:4080 length:522 start_codon:yes stop_codon:yes gene_type:complete